MSEDIFKKLEQLARRDIVDERWFARNRRYIMSYVARHPRAKATRISIFARYMFRTVPAVAFVTLIFMVSAGGVTLAAQNSIPGDFLYSWKIGVVESIESVFVVGAQSQAQFEVAKTTRRLQEVTDLAIRKETNTKITSEAQSRLEIQVKAATDQISVVASEDKGKALETALELSATLQAHKDVLNQLQPKTSSEVQSNIQGAISAIDQNAVGVGETIKDLQEQNKQHLGDIFAKLDAAKKKLDGIWTLVAGLDDSTLLRIEAERTLIFAQDALVTADEDLKSQQYGDVMSDIQTALQFMSETTALLDASKNASDTVKDILITPSPSPSVTATATPTMTPTPSLSPTPSISATPSSNLLNQ